MSTAVRSKQIDHALEFLAFTLDMYGYNLINPRVTWRDSGSLFDPVFALRTLCICPRADPGRASATPCAGRHAHVGMP